jgi:hypothetical protein
MDVKTAVEIITSCTSARDAIEKLNLPRCRLHALLTSRAFIQTMEDYRTITKCIITYRAGQYGGWMMGNLANLTNGRNEDSSRKACMAGLSQAMDGHIRPGPACAAVAATARRRPGRPAKVPTFPAPTTDGRAAPSATPDSPHGSCRPKVCPERLPSPQTHAQSTPASPAAPHTLEYQDVAPGGPLPDLRQSILSFIQNGPPRPQDSADGPFPIDNDRQIPTEMHTPFLTNPMQTQELQLSGHREKSEPLLQCETSPVAS